MVQSTFCASSGVYKEDMTDGLSSPIQRACRRAIGAVQYKRMCDAVPVFRRRKASGACAYRCVN